MRVREVGGRREVNPRRLRRPCRTASLKSSLVLSGRILSKPKFVASARSPAIDRTVVQREPVVGNHGPVPQLRLPAASATRPAPKRRPVEGSGVNTIGGGSPRGANNP